jgi:hypothetical protein
MVNLVMKNATVGLEILCMGLHTYIFVVRFEVFTTVALKNAVFWEPQGGTSQKTAFFEYLHYLQVV